MPPFKKLFIYTVTTLMCLSSLGVTAKEKPEALLDKLYLDGIPGGSLELHRLLANDLKSSMGDEKYISQLNSCQGKASIGQEDLTKMLDAYKRTQGQYRSSVEYVKFVQLTSNVISAGANTAFGVAAIAGGPGGAAFGLVGTSVLEASKIVMEETSTRALEALEENRQTQSAKLLTHGLGELRERNAAEIARIMAAPLEIRKEELLGKNGVLFQTDLWKNLDPKDHGVVLRQMSLALVDTMAKERDERKLYEKLSDTALAEVKTELKKTNQVLDAFATSVAKDFETVYKQQKVFADSLAAVTDTVTRHGKDIAQTKGDIDQLQRVLWNKMQPTERLKELQTGQFFRNLPDAKRLELLKETKNLASAQEITDAVHRITNPASTILNISLQLGVNPKTVSNIKKGIDVANMAASACTSFMTGNYLGAAMSVLGAIGIFGGGGPDADAIRHQQIMKRLDQIMAGQRKIMEGINVIIKNQKLIVERLYEIELLMQRQHQELLSKLDVMHADLRMAQRGISEVLKEKISECEVFLSVPDYQKGFKNSRFTSFEAFRNYLSENQRRLKSCIDGLGLKTFVSPTQGISSIFLIKSKASADLSTRDEKFLRYKKGVYDPTLNLSQRLHPFFNTDGSERNEQLFFGALASPSFSLGRLDQLHPSGGFPEARTKYSPFKTYFGKEISAAELLRDPIDFQEVSVVKEIVQGLLPYLELLKEDGTDSPEIYTLDELSKLEVGESKSLGNRMRILSGMIDVIKMAIAQETVISGQYILDPLVNELDLYEFNRSWADRKKLAAAIRNRGSVKNPNPVPEVLKSCTTGDLFIDSICTMEKNPYLQNNVVNYLLRRVIRERKSNFSAYHLLESVLVEGDLKFFRPENHSIKTDVVGDLPMVYFDGVKTAQEKGWHLKLIHSDGSDWFIKIPTSAELSRGALSFSSTMDQLIAWKYQLLDRLDEIKLMNDPQLGSGGQVLRNLAFMKVNASRTEP